MYLDDPVVDEPFPRFISNNPSPTDTIVKRQGIGTHIILMRWDYIQTHIRMGLHPHDGMELRDGCVLEMKVRWAYILIAMTSP